MGLSTLPLFLWFPFVLHYQSNMMNEIGLAAYSLLSATNQNQSNQLINLYLFIIIIYTSISLLTSLAFPSMFLNESIFNHNNGRYSKWKVNYGLHTISFIRLRWNSRQGHSFDVKNSAQWNEFKSFSLIIVAI